MSASPDTQVATVPPAASQIRWVDYADPLVRPMLAELDHEYGRRYGHSLGDLDEETARERARFAAPGGGLLLLFDGPAAVDGPGALDVTDPLDGAVPIAGGAFRRKDSDTAELKRIWTGSAHRRRGLARRVLVELEREIAARGYRRIYLTTGPRQPEAQGLYLATGYTPLYNRSRPPEEIGPHPFEKLIAGKPS